MTKQEIFNEYEKLNPIDKLWLSIKIMKQKEEEFNLNRKEIAETLDKMINENGEPYLDVNWIKKHILKEK